MTRTQSLACAWTLVTVGLVLIAAGWPYGLAVELVGCCWYLLEVE